MLIYYMVHSDDFWNPKIFLVAMKQPAESIIQKQN